METVYDITTTKWKAQSDKNKFHKFSLKVRRIM